MTPVKVLITYNYITVLAKFNSPKTLTAAEAPRLAAVVLSAVPESRAFGFRVWG